MSSRRGPTLGGVAPTELVDARLQLHHAAQVVASVGKTLLEPRPDDGHPNLGWLAVAEALAGHVVGDGSRFQAALDPAGARLLLLDGDGALAGDFALRGHALPDAYAWLAWVITDRFGRALPSGLVSPGYELPDHPIARGAPFTAAPEACAEVGRWLDAADAAITELAARTEGASDVRCWPHHFDLATLVTVERAADGSASRTIGVGLSPGDESYPEPYAYVSPWPYPDAKAHLPPLPVGCWHRDGYTAAILTGSELLAGGPDAEQSDRLREFLDTAVAACRRIHGL